METLELTYIDENTDIDALLEPYMAPVEVIYREINDWGNRHTYLVVTNDEIAIANIEKIAGRYLDRAYCFENYCRLVLKKEPTIIRYAVTVRAEKLLNRLAASEWIKSIGGVKHEDVNV